MDPVKGMQVDLRNNYGKDALNEKEAGDDPIALFGRWLEQAKSQNVPEYNAMALATSGTDHLSCRMVLLRSFDAEGFVFFSNYNSRKASDLESDTRAALTFFWPSLERQVRIEGKTEVLSAEESDASVSYTHLLYVSPSV